MHSLRFDLYPTALLIQWKMQMHICDISTPTQLCPSLSPCLHRICLNDKCTIIQRFSICLFLIPSPPLCQTDDNNTYIHIHIRLPQLSVVAIVYLLDCRRILHHLTQSTIQILLNVPKSHYKATIRAGLLGCYKSSSHAERLAGESCSSLRHQSAKPPTTTPRDSAATSTLAVFKVHCASCRCKVLNLTSYTEEQRLPMP